MERKETTRDTWCAKRNTSPDRHEDKLNNVIGLNEEEEDDDNNKTTNEMELREDLLFHLSPIRGMSSLTEQEKLGSKTGGNRKIENKLQNQGIE